MYYYADAESADFLRGPAPRLYLYGSYEGYSNFGDVLQLKSVVDFYRARGGIDIVVVIQLQSLLDSDHVERMRRWLGVRHILAISSERLEASAVGQQRLATLPRGGHAHLYGGGYFNAMWGSPRVQMVDEFVDRLGVERYVISGVQLDDTVVDGLDRVFAKRAPELFGVRDYESIAVAEATTAREAVRFSFDDVTECMRAWAPTLAPRGELGSRGEIGFHLNLTAEYIDSVSQLDRARAVLDRMRATSPDAGLALLHAYDDRRELVKDSLPSLKAFDVDFPYDEFRVVDTGRMSLELDVPGGGFPGSERTLALDYSVVSSYHTAMIQHIVGVPSYLISANEYYRQKAAIFELPDTVEEFLAEPAAHVRDFAPEWVRRDAWNAELESVVSTWSDDALVGTVAVDDPEPQPTKGRWGRSIPAEPLAEWPFTGKV